MNTLPLLTGTTPDACIIAGAGTLGAAEFAAQAEALSSRLPGESHVILLAENRRHFLLAWVAACLRGQVILLPPNQAPATLDALRREYPRSHVLDDAAVARSLDPGVSPAPELPAWTVPVDRVVAVAFTSGSTGRPQPHAKTWGSLFHNSTLAARDVLGSVGRSVVATVPAQHMYGLEASLLCALTAGCRIIEAKPFFPADVRAALAALPAPRTLVTTPAHLRVLAAAGIDMPELSRVVSATAPLSAELAAELEQRWRTEIFEIYGCTEAGVMAHRRTTRSQRWRTLAGGTVACHEGAAEYRAPQLGAPVPLPDLIAPHGDTEFELLGRVGDMIKVAGKRSSLQELTQQVLSVPGVADAVVFVPSDERPAANVDDERPAALVVAPGLTTVGLIAQLRRIMDPVFIPRPLVLTDRLPRNEVGKLPRESLVRVLRESAAPRASHEGSTDVPVIRIAADHPSLAGHFPGNPLVPGVVLLDAALRHLRERRPGAIASLPGVKFLAPVRAGEVIHLRLEIAGDRARFTGLRGDAPVFEGSVVFAS